MSLIKVLRQQAEDARRAELTRALRQMPESPDGYLDATESLNLSIVKKLLHHATTSQKRQVGNSQLEAIGDIYQLKGE